MFTFTIPLVVDKKIHINMQLLPSHINHEMDKTGKNVFLTSSIIDAYNKL